MLAEGNHGAAGYSGTSVADQLFAGSTKGLDVFQADSTAFKTASDSDVFQQGSEATSLVFQGSLGGDDSDSDQRLPGQTSISTEAITREAEQAAAQYAAEQQQPLASTPNEDANAVGSSPVANAATGSPERQRPRVERPPVAAAAISKQPTGKPAPTASRSRPPPPLPTSKPPVDDGGSSPREVLWHSGLRADIRDARREFG